MFIESFINYIYLKWIADKIIYTYIYIIHIWQIWKKNTKRYRIKLKKKTLRSNRCEHCVRKNNLKRRPFCSVYLTKLNSFDFILHSRFKYYNLKITWNHTRVHPYTETHIYTHLCIINSIQTYIYIIKLETTSSKTTTKIIHETSDANVRHHFTRINTHFYCNIYAINEVYLLVVINNITYNQYKIQIFCICSNSVSFGV